MSDTFFKINRQKESKCKEKGEQRGEEKSGAGVAEVAVAAVAIFGEVEKRQEAGVVIAQVRRNALFGDGQKRYVAANLFL